MSKPTDWRGVFAKHGAQIKKWASEVETRAALSLLVAERLKLPVITESAFEHAWRLHGKKMGSIRDHLGAAKPANPEERAQATIEGWRQQQSRRADRSVAQTLSAKVHELERQISVLTDVHAKVPALPSQPLVAKHRAGGKRMEATAVALASDWHVEERVKPESVNGMNAYNLDVSRARAEKFFRGILWLTNHHRAGFDIDNLVLWLGGDLISGYIHEELEESNFLAPPEAILYAMDLLVSGIDLLLAEGKFKRIVVPCNRGNHGRTTKKKRVSTGSANSYEWMLYRLLRQHYAKETRLEWVIADGDHAYVDVYGYTMRFLHGDTFNYGGGVGGMIVPIRRGIERLQKYRRADITCLGHFHQLGDYGDIVTNGSLIGYNAFALSIAASYEPPQQGFFLVEPRHGKCQSTAIWLT